MASNDDTPDDNLFMSPVVRPAFCDPPLSTKREKKRMYSRIPGSVPRFVKSAPARNRFLPRHFDPTPRRISFLTKGHALNSPIYDSSKIEESFFEQCFQFERKLGEGSFGEVFAVISREDGQSYAVKRVMETFRSKHDRDLKLREVQKHELLPPHENLVHFVKAWEERGRLFIQTELCEKSLSEYAQNSIPEGEVWNFMIDLLLAVNHLHKNDLIHADIKPDNIFLTKDHVCKLGDFGRIFDIRNDSPDEAEEGDCKYLATEVLNGIPTKEADIFSLGITILELATNLDLPSHGVEWQNIRSRKIHPRFLSQISNELTSLILLMMDPDPQRRPTAEQLLNDDVVVRKMRKRRLHIKVLHCYNTVTSYMHGFYLILLTINLLLKRAFSHVAHAFYSSKHEVVSASFVRTPEGHRNRPNSSLDWSFSDEENYHSIRSGAITPPLYAHDEERLSSIRQRLTFDEEGTPTSCSDPSDTVEHSEMRHLPTTPPSARSKRLSSRAKFIGRSGPKGDWSDADTSDEEPGPSYVDHARTCPTVFPRIPLRAQQSAGKKIPRLNLNLLSENSEQTREGRRKPVFSQRMITDRGSSADEC